MALTRRQIWLTGSAAMSMVAWPARASDGRLVFDVYRNGSKIGTHAITLRASGARVEVDIAIDLEVTLAIVPVYTYRHRNHEVYEGAELVSMSSRTNDNGEELRVDIHRDGDELVIDGSAGTRRVAGELIPTTYWQPRTVERERWIDSQNGRVLSIEVRDEGTERIRYEGRMLECRRYAFSGEAEGVLWYGPEGWAKFAFEVRDSRIEYRRLPESDVASLPLAVPS